MLGAFPVRLAHLCEPSIIKKSSLREKDENKLNHSRVLLDMIKVVSNFFWDTRIIVKTNRKDQCENHIKNDAIRDTFQITLAARVSHIRSFGHWQVRKVT